MLTFNDQLEQVRNTTFSSSDQNISVIFGLRSLTLNLVYSTEPETSDISFWCLTNRSKVILKIMVRPTSS